MRLPFSWLARFVAALKLATCVSDARQHRKRPRRTWSGAKSFDTNDAAGSTSYNERHDSNSEKYNVKEEVEKSAAQ